MGKWFVLFMSLAVLAATLIFYYNVKLYFKIQQNNDKVVFAEKILNETQEAKTVMEKNLITRDSEINNNKNQLEAEKNKSIELSKKLSEKVNEALIIKDELRKTRSELEKNIKDSEGEKENLKKISEENENYRKENIDYRERLERFKNLAPDASKTSTEAAEHKTQATTAEQKKKRDGKVLLVNKDYNFILIDLGVVDGVYEGQIAKVFRNGAAVCSVRIEKLYEKMSSAVLLEGTKKVSDISQNDVVKIES